MFLTPESGTNLWFYYCSIAYMSEFVSVVTGITAKSTRKNTSGGLMGSSYAKKVIFWKISSIKKTSKGHQIETNFKSFLYSSANRVKFIFSTLSIKDAIGTVNDAFQSIEDLHR